MSICDDCILNGRCSGSCDDTNPLFLAFEKENDEYDIRKSEED